MQISGVNIYESVEACYHFSVICNITASRDCTFYRIKHQKIQLVLLIKFMAYQLI